jgi:uncharacterized protein (TIGR02001 family)
MFRKQLMTAVAAAFAGMSFAAMSFAQDKQDKLVPGDFAASVAFTTDYVFRGISQTDSGPAVQGSVEYTYMFQPEIGVYAGIWGSSVDFDEASAPGVDKASAEFDLTGGLKGEVRGITWQLGFIHYAYPKGRPSADFDYDYTEVVAKLGYDFGVVAITGGVNYSPDFFSETDSGVYWSGDATVPLPFLPLQARLLGHIGHQSIENNARFGAPDYVDWLIGAGITVEGFALTLAYTDTDIEMSRCFPGTGLTETCEGRVVFTVSKSF